MQSLYIYIYVYTPKWPKLSQIWALHLPVDQGHIHKESVLFEDPSKNTRSVAGGK